MSNDDFKNIADKRIKDITKIFIDIFNPEKIILFGSYGRHEYKPDSSIDILIIADTKEGFIERIKRAINVSSGFPPIEPLIYTKEELNELSEEKDPFVENALSEGVVLYSRD